MERSTLRVARKEGTQGCGSSFSTRWGGRGGECVHAGTVPRGCLKMGDVRGLCFRCLYENCVVCVQSIFVGVHVALDKNHMISA